MKMHRVMFLFTALALAGAALADPTAPDAGTLGRIEGILNKCAQLDPAHAAQYLDEIKMVTQGTSDEAVGKVRKSEAYKQAYDSATDSLAAVAGQEAVKACTGSLAPTN